MKKVTPLSQQLLSKNLRFSQAPLFENLVGGSTPLTERAGTHYAKLMPTLKNEAPPPTETPPPHLKVKPPSRK